MKNHFSISIPQPCHEDWNKMTSKEKGRFCASCSKTVIDFTKLEQHEIIDYIQQNKQNRICGHFKQSQLDSINLRIPIQTLTTKKFHRLFLWSLLIVMGTSLMNCTNKQGNVQKIDSVEVIDSIDNKVIDVLDGLPSIEGIDSLSTKKRKIKKENNSIKTIPPPTEPTGIVVIETLGEVIIEEAPVQIDSIDVIETTWCPSPPRNEEYEDELILGFIVIETPPEFKETPQNLSATEKRAYFQEKVNAFVSKNFNLNTTLNLGLSGTQKIHAQFKIDSLGFIKNIKIRAAHPKFEEEATRVIKLLPQFIPAKQEGKPVPVVYNLPIVFQIED